MTTHSDSSRNSPSEDAGSSRATDVNALRPNSAVPNHVVAQGIIANGPLLCMGAVMTSAAIYARGALPLAYLLGAILVWMWINTPLQFSKRLASSGGMFYFVTKGSGLGIGSIAGVSYAIYYTAFAAAGAVYFSVMAQSLLAQFRLPTGPEWIWAILPVGVLFIPGVLVYRGIRPSLRYGMVTGLAELVLMVVVSIVIVALSGKANTARVFNPTLAHHGFAGVGIGMLLSAFSMSGSTATVYLGHEAHMAHRSIRRALLVSTTAVVVVFLLVSYAMTVGWGPAKMASFSGSNIPGLLIIGHCLGKPFELLTAVFMANSIFSAIVASTLVVSRVTHSMARAGVMPRGLSSVDRAGGTPRAAVTTCLGLAAAGSVAASAIWNPNTAFIVLILVGTMGEFIGHIIGNLALPRFATRSHIFRPAVHLLLPAASLITTAIGVYYTVFPVSFPTAWGPILFGVGLLSFIGFLAIKKARPLPSNSPGIAALGKELGIELVVHEVAPKAG